MNALFFFALLAVFVIHHSQNIRRLSTSGIVTDQVLMCGKGLWRRDYLDVAFLVGNLNSHGIILTFEK
jgi:hypothetical protein